jgi:hypothetical protein
MEKSDSSGSVPLDLSALTLENDKKILTIDDIDKCALKFVNKLINGDFDLIEFLNSVNSGPFINFNTSKFEDNSPILYGVCEFLNISLSTLIITDGIQSIEETTFGDILIEISKKNCHNETSDEKLHTCVFHRESLITHLLFAMLKTIENLPKSMSNKKRTQLAITALLHDVGKYGCTSFSKYKGDFVTAFPFHGEYGAGILIKLWHNGFAKFFDKKEWEALVRTVSVHMCGYNEIDIETVQAKFKCELLSIENYIVKDNLYWLSFGDKLGTCPDLALEEGVAMDKRKFIESRESFKNNINKTFVIADFMSKNNLCGFLIQVCGMSGSGKSTLIAKISDFLILKEVDPKAIVIIERDIIMANITKKRLCEPQDNTKPSGSEYKRIYKEYKRLKLGDFVNKKMSRMIDDGIRQGKVVIVDSVANYFRANDSICSASVSKCFKVSIDVLRNYLFTEEDGERIGLNLEEQIKIFGDISFLDWLENGIMPSKNGYGRLSSLTTLSTSRRLEDTIEKSSTSKTHPTLCETRESEASKLASMNIHASRSESCKTRVRPHLRYQISWDLGISSLFECLEHVSNNIKIMDVTENDEDKMEINQLINYLFDKGGYDEVKKFFSERAYLCSVPALMKNTEYSDCTFYIKYMEHCRIFNKKFSRQGRGSIFTRLPSGKIICIKNLLQRGIECITGVHIKKGITENENIDIHEDLSYLDETQQNIMKKFIKKESLDGWLSFKNDGSLSGLTLYPRGQEVYGVMLDLIQRSTDPRDVFTKMLVDEAIRRDYPFIPVLSSSGTLTMSEGMLSYNVTAICCGMCGISHDILKNDAKNGMSPEFAFMTYASDRFFANLLSFWDKSPNSCQNEIMCLSFEAIVPNRVCAWNGFHPELAMSYPSSSYRFLGCMYNVGETAGQYRAHFQLESVIYGTGWDQPLSWKVKHTRQIESMINDLSSILHDEMTEDEFIKKHPPYCMENVSTTFDYEGFVLFTNIENSEPIGLTSFEENINNNSDCDVDYEKIKSEEYYKSHKLKEENIEFLLDLPDSASSKIPIVKALKEFYPSLNSSLLQISCSIRNILVESFKCEGVLYDSIPTQKAKDSFKNQDYKIKSKMIVNISPEWKKISFQICKDVFPSLSNKEEDSTELEEVHGFIKRLAMAIEPWNEEYVKNIEDMIDDRSKVIKELFLIIISSQKILL